MRHRTLRAGVLSVAFLASFPSSVEGRAIRPPIVGNWEGKGPHGLALSFELARSRSRIRAAAVAVTLPVGCPATVRNALAVAGTRAVYAGPRAAPPGLSHPLLSKPGTIGLSFTAQQFPVFLEGRLVDPRHVTLSMAAPAGRTTACWPRTLGFTTRPAVRASVADGRWIGTLTAANGVTGTIRLDVVGRGRAISSFTFNVRCNDNPSGSPNYGYGPDVNGQFIAADGSFSGPAAHSAAPGIPFVWHGHFSAGVLDGGFTNLESPCEPGAELGATFTARHG